MRPSAVLPGIGHTRVARLGGPPGERGSAIFRSHPPLRAAFERAREANAPPRSVLA